MGVKRLRHILAFAVLSLPLSFPVAAQYVGPSAVGEASVAAILQNPIDDQDVQLTGNLVRKTNHEKYVFSDGSGEIVVEIDAKRFPDQPIDEKTKVEITGEVDTGFSRAPEIEVDSLRIVN